MAHLIFPDNVQTLPAVDPAPSGPEGRLSVARVAPDDEVVDDAVELLRKRQATRSSLSDMAHAMQ